jgi:hypothetical protein
MGREINWRTDSKKCQSGICTCPHDAPFCASTEKCQRASSCAPKCTPPQILCNGACVTSTTVTALGATCGCGATCGTGLSCSGGRCACASGTVECGGVCTTVTLLNLYGDCTVCGTQVSRLVKDNSPEDGRSADAVASTIVRW